ncbi:MAG: hypothetical protein RR514_03025 [Christensenella sp.]
MSYIIHSVIHSAELKHLVAKHPCLVDVLLMVGMPLGILFAVLSVTYAVTVPILFLLGRL